MEVAMINSGETEEEKPSPLTPLRQSPDAQSAESVKRSSKVVKHNGPVAAIRASTSAMHVRKKSAGNEVPEKTSNRLKSTVTRPTISSAAATSRRRNSMGSVLEKASMPSQKHIDDVGGGSLGAKKVSSSVGGKPKGTISDSRKTSLSSNSKKIPVTEAKKPSIVSHLTPKSDPTRKTSIRPSLSVSASTKASSSPCDSTGRSTLRRAASSLSSPSSRPPLVTSSMKSGSLSSSLDKSSNFLGRKKVNTPDGRDSRFIMLPQIEVKAGDDLRIDLRGHRVRSLTARGLNLSSNLEFVYLRDNLLSSLEGIDVLKRVKVLDLSFNDFKGPGFEPLGNCKALQQLYLAGNHITSLASLPELPNLEFLSVAQNRLKNLCMASQPRLQVLAASKNKISTLKGFSNFPLLEHLRVEENPILDVPHLEAATILLVGPTLKKFNDRDLSDEEVELAKHYPPHTALCIRDGWEFCLPELAAESTFRFLVEQWKDKLPPGYSIKEISIDHPFEGDVCHCNFAFSTDPAIKIENGLVLRYQWFIGERIPTNFIAIDDAVGEIYWPKRDDIGKLLKVECTPVLQGNEYPSIFALSSPVSPGTGCPRALNLTVRGELIEGNVIKGCAEVAWCGGTPCKGVTSWLRKKWNSNPIVIAGAEEEEYQLIIDDVDSSLVFMYTPVTEEGVKGEPQYAMTDFVRAAAPSVNNVKILGDVIEGTTLKGLGQYFGGKEGPSKFEWSRQNKNTGDLLLVSAGTTEYTLTKHDIGWRIAFEYIPANFEGKEGVPVSAVTDTVRKAPPRASGLKIIGELREGSKITISALVAGGTEGSSRVQWFKSSSSSFENEDSLEAVSTSKIAKAFRIPLGAVGYYLVAKFTPMAPDGEFGEPAYTISGKAVETLPPSLNFLSVTGDYSEGEMLTASYGYIGGHEGKSTYNWYLHESESDSGVLIPEASGFLQYRITRGAINKFISFKCTPVRDDGIAGDPRICMALERVRPGSPRLLSLQIVGECIEGTTLFADKKYWGGDEGDSVFRWYLISDDGTQKEIAGATTASHTLSSGDVGFMVSVSCEPIRSDLTHGPIVISQKNGPILPGPPVCKSLEFQGLMIEGERLNFITSYFGGEKGNCSYEWFRVKNNGLKERLSCHEYYDLTLLDVGGCIELVYTPVRKDGLKGTPTSIVSRVIIPANPKGLQLLVPDCFEDQEVVPQKVYYGGQEGIGQYIWYRTKKKIDGQDLLKISVSEEVLIVGNALSHTPSLEDVGAYLVLYWVPTRADGNVGNPVVAASKSPVSAALPVVSNVCAREIAFGVYAGEGQYYGGYEGSSLYNWYRETKEGNINLIDGANSTKYDVTDSDYNCRLLFGYTPVRSDSIVGEVKLSEPSEIILPVLAHIERLSFKGKQMEGETLTAVEIIPKDDAQQKVWSNYINDIRYQWFYSTVDDNEAFVLLPAQCSRSYKLRMEDIGRCLKCDCYVTDVFKRSCETASAVTAPILPGFPKIDKLEIEGRGFHTNLYAVRGVYNGGKEGKSKIQWLRSMVGSPDLISIPGETGRMYEANVDDVGYRLVAVYTPLREDGVEGQPVSASTEPIAVEPDVYKEVKQKVDLGSVKFEVLCDKDQSQRKIQGVGNLERRILEVNRKRVKVVKPGSKTSFPTTDIRGTYAPPFHVELCRNDQHRFKIVVDGENDVDLMVQTRHMRDVIVLVIRGLAQRFNSTSLNSLLKIES